MNIGELAEKAVHTIEQPVSKVAAALKIVRVFKTQVMPAIQAMKEAVEEFDNA